MMTVLRSLSKVEIIEGDCWRLPTWFLLQSNFVSEIIRRLKIANNI